MQPKVAHINRGIAITAPNLDLLLLFGQFEKENFALYYETCQTRCDEPDCRLPEAATISAVRRPAVPP